MNDKNPHGSRPDGIRLRESIPSIDDFSAMHPELLRHWRLTTSFCTARRTVKVDGVGYVWLCAQANSSESWLICVHADASLRS